MMRAGSGRGKGEGKVRHRNEGGGARAGLETYEEGIVLRSDDGDVVLVRLERLEQAVSRLLPASQSVNLDLDSTIRADIKTRTEVMRTEIELGVASIDEWRHRTDRMPVPGGDIYRIPGPKAPEPTVRSEG